MEYFANENNESTTFRLCRKHKRRKIENSTTILNTTEYTATSPMSFDVLKLNVTGFPTSPATIDTRTENSVYPTNVAYSMDSSYTELSVANPSNPKNDVACLEKQQNETATDLPDNKLPSMPSEPRPIINTSLLKLAAQNQQQQQQQSLQQPSSKGRLPLATVSNKNIMIKPNEVNLKKPIDVAAEDDFFFFKLKTPLLLNENYFSKLSDEMILSIFKWLPKKTLMRCSYVCRRFCIVAQDESLWTRLDLAGKHIRAGALGKILSRGIVIFRLAQTKIADPIFDVTEMPCDFLCKLQYLDLSMAVISKSALKELFTRCRQLKKLSLEHVSIDTSICTEIAENRNLEALNLTMCDGIDITGVRILMSSLQSLQSLNISWTSLNCDAVKMFVETVPTELTRLNIAGCRKSMTDSYLTILVERCPNLIELDLSDCGVLTSDTVKIVSKLTKLEYLSLSRCYNISIASYIAINELISLAYLDIFGVLSDQALKSLRQQFPSVGINQFIYSAVARPTVGSRRTSIWGLRTRD